MNNSIYYVYVHYDPVTSKPVYVGMGQKGRAWAITNSGGSNAAYGHRCKEHYHWFLQCEEKGYTLDELVSIESKNLSKDQALEEERQLIDTLKPLFNKKQGLKNLKITEDNYHAALAMRDDGMSYSAIAQELGLSTMTVYRALNGKTKNVEW